MTFRVVPEIHKARKTPVNAKGSENIIINGSLKDSNCEAITIYTRVMLNINKRMRSLKLSCMSFALPPYSISISGGIFIWETCRLSSAVTVERSVCIRDAVTLTNLSLFSLSIFGGLKYCSTDAISPNRINCPLMFWIVIFSRSTVDCLNFSS